VNVNPGSFVGQNTPAFQLVSAEREIDFSVPPSDAPSLPLGSLVRFTFEGRTYPVRILQAPSAPISGIVPVVAAVPAASRLPYGAVGTVAYSRTLAAGAQIPIAALELVENTNYVFVIETDKVKLEPVTIIDESGGMAVVSGVQVGSRVVLNPPPGMLDGTRVQLMGEAKGAEGGGPQP
jgi:HlyD family secretion protein